jgi:hypothetical protein
MPNWCHNTLFVEGDLDELVDFKSKVLVQSDYEKGGLDFTMEVLHPTPPELLEMTSPVMWRGEDDDEEGERAFQEHTKAIEEKYGYSDWYDWRVSNWGTKWNATDSSIDEHNGEALTIEYDTAWGPNTLFVKFASEKYRKLKFRLLYEEPGCNFCGELECEDGEVQFDDEGEMEYEDQDGNAVEYDNEKERWCIIESGEVIDDEDFYPSSINPFR